MESPEKKERRIDDLNALLAERKWLRYDDSNGAYVISKTEKGILVMKTKEVRNREMVTKIFLNDDLTLKSALDLHLTPGKDVREEVWDIPEDERPPKAYQDEVYRVIDALIEQNAQGDIGGWSRKL